MAYFRNVQTGEIREMVPFSPEHEKIREEKYDLNGKSYYAWEETSAPDADPKAFAHSNEVLSRASHGVSDLSQVKADGTPTSLAAAERLSKVDGARQADEGASRDVPPAHKGRKAPADA